MGCAALAVVVGVLDMTLLEAHPEIRDEKIQKERGRS